MKTINIIYKYSTDSRLDRFLVHNFPFLTNGIINQYLRKKYILVNKKKSASNLRLFINDIIKVPEFFRTHYVKKKTIIFNDHSKIIAKKMLNDYLILETKYFIAINKPPFLAVQGGSKIKYSINSAIDYLNSIGGDYRIVHRIDKDTSGILLIAKDLDSARIITKAFREKLIIKTYHAILKGSLSNNDGWIIDGKYKSENNDIIDTSSSITRYKVEKIYDHYTHVIFYPITGKNHQLRKDALNINHPILGDTKYSENNIFKTRLMLHATEVLIPSELFGQKYKITIKLPEEFFNKNILTNRDHNLVLD